MALLTYQANELIFKEGDFGATIYRVIGGRIRLYTGTGLDRINRGEVEAGRMFGVDAFIHRGFGKRLFSARAVSETHLESWHVETLYQEFENLSPFLRYTVNQPIKRLARAQKLLTGMKTKSPFFPNPAAAGTDAPGRAEDLGRQRRQFYRKSVDVACQYTPHPAGRPQMDGRLVDLSRGGAGMTIDGSNLRLSNHSPGDQFRLDFQLPSGKGINFIAELVRQRPTEEGHRVFLNLSIKNIGYEANKRLGFFLM
jgi:CRP-like cAMP-binding protein